MTYPEITKREVVVESGNLEPDRLVSLPLISAGNNLLQREKSFTLCYQWGEIERLTARRCSNTSDFAVAGSIRPGSFSFLGSPEFPVS
jgi:hypothetical protein